MATLTCRDGYLDGSFVHQNIAVVVAGWDLAGADGELLANLADYRSAAVQVAAWLMLAAVVTAGSVLLLRGRGGRRSSWTMAALAVAISTVVAAGCPRDHMLAADWGWGIAGWIAVLVLLRRPLADLEAVGVIPAVPAGTRRVLTDLAITILSAAATRARITVAAAGDGLIVSFVADCPADAPLPSSESDIAISQQRDDDVLWVEARWNVR